jgi:hypothetical protein
MNSASVQGFFVSPSIPATAFVHRLSALDTFNASCPGKKWASSCQSKEEQLFRHAKAQTAMLPKRVSSFREVENKAKSKPPKYQNMALSVWL